MLPESGVSATGRAASLFERGARHKRWVFIRPAAESSYYDPEIQEPLGLEYLAASRRQRGERVLVLDSTLEGASDTKLARRAASFAPEAIGFSLMTAQEVPSVLAIHAECRSKLGERSVAWLAGGNFISTEPGPAQQMLPAEFLLVRFEGEDALETGCHWHPGRDGCGGGKATAGPADRVLEGEPVTDLDSLPFPDRPFADQLLGNGGAFTMQGSRGCCGACRYCSSPGMGHGHNPWRGRSARHIAEELSELRTRYHAAAFNFIDEDFLGPPAGADARARAFTEELQKRGLRLSFGLQARPHSLSEEAIAVLARAGLTYVFLGIESDCEADCHRWARPWVADPWLTLDLLRKHDVEVGVGSLLFHSHASLSSIRRFAERLHRHHLLNYRTALNRMEAMPGSRYHAEGIAAGWIDPEVPGPHPIPYRCAEVGQLHRDLRTVLGPLGPPSMHAVCALPPLLAQRRLDGRRALEVDRLRELLRFLDRAVADAFFAVLGWYERQARRAELVNELRDHSLELAVTAVTALVEQGFARSRETLRQAIRLDGGV